MAGRRNSPVRLMALLTLALWTPRTASRGRASRPNWLTAGGAADAAFTRAFVAGLRGAGSATLRAARRPRARASDGLRAAQALATRRRGPRTGGRADAEFSRRLVARLATVRRKLLAPLDAPLSWESGAGRGALGAAEALLRVPLARAAAELRELRLPGLNGNYSYERAGFVAHYELRAVRIDGLDSALRAPALAPDGDAHFKLSAGPAELLARAELCADIRLAALHGRGPALALRNLSVSASLRAVRLMTRWHCVLRPGTLLATKPVAALAGMRPTIDSVRIDVGHIEVHPPRHARAPSASCRSPARAARAADWHDAILYGEAPLADDDDDVVEATPRAEEADASTSRALVTDADAAAHGGARGMVAADDVADAEHGARPSRVVWRALSANLSERLGVLIAREVEGLLLARLRDLTLQDAVL